MIGKIIKGSGFRGAVEYDLQPGKSVLLETNMAGSTPRSFAAEFGVVRAMRPGLGIAVGHVSISIHPDERLTDDQWREAAHTWMQGMGFVNNQYIISRHTDAAHPHIHILVNRITLDGQVVSDAHDFKRQEPIMRRLEQHFGLRMVPPSQEVGRTSPTKGELEHSLRTGEASSRMRLQNAVDTALDRGCSLEVFRDRLALVGVEVRLNTASTGFISGISFSLDGVAFKGSKLGKNYTWNALQQRGLRHEQDRRRSEEELGLGDGIGRGWSGIGGSRDASGSPFLAEQAGIFEGQEYGRSDFTFGEPRENNKECHREREVSRSRSQGLSR
ncbi:MAG: relaxase/mobilization nuclease domain-containing protein [Solidesulfovibrio sp.]